MTRDEAKDYLPLIQALADGKTIQVKEDDGTWADLHSPSFWNDPCFYRIKPKVIWVNEYPLDDYCVSSSEVEAKRYAEKSAIRIAVRYVEMPEDTSNQ
jgi:hypothetical protein